MKVRPDRGIAIEILAPLAVPQPDAFSAFDHQGLMRRITPSTLLREWMPAVRAIPREPLIRPFIHCRHRV